MAMNKGVFVTLSAFFLALSLLLIVSAISDIGNAKKKNNAELSDIHGISSMRSNIQWMMKDAFAVSGFTYAISNTTLSIEENSSRSGSLSGDLAALRTFWNNVAGKNKNVTLDFESNASTPVLYIRPLNLTLRQEPTDTSVSVPSYSNSSVLGYYIILETSCSSLSMQWNNITESSAPDALNVTVHVRCSNTSESRSDFRQLNRTGYSELQVLDAGTNLSLITISSPGSLEVRKSRSAYLNIMMPMNESVYLEVPASLSIRSGDSAYSGALRLPG